MRFFSEFSAAAAAAMLSVASAALIARSPMTNCANEEVAGTTYIGVDRNVKVSFSHCTNEEFVDARGERSRLTKRSNNVCGNTCNTYCWENATGAATTSDCTVIADALLYESQHTGVFFNDTAFGTQTNKITMSYNTCETYFLNQDSSNITYCRTDWSQLVNWLASDCSADNNAHGGLCVAADERWYVQVQHT